MGLLKSLFRSGSEDNNVNVINWNKLENISDIDEIIDQSELNTIVIFKHSTRCGISSSVLRRFEKQTNPQTDGTDFFLLNVIKHRNISNEISKRLSIHHESPQLVIIKNREVIAHDSHYDILNMDLTRY